MAAVEASIAFGQRAIFLIGPLAVTGYIAGLLLGEMIMPPPGRGPVRHGSLDRRSLERYLNYGWVWGWRVLAGTAVGAIIIGGLVGARDSRSLTLTCANGTSATASPWPGWSFGAPGLVSLLIGVLLVEISMRRAVARPRPDAAVMDAVTDDAVRAASIKRAVAAGMAMALVPLAGVGLSAAMILSFICSPPGSLGWTSPTAVVVAIGGSGAAIGALVALAWLLRFGEASAYSTGTGRAQESVHRWS